LTALFVFNGAIDGLDRRLQLNEPRAGVYCLFTLKWRRDDLCEGASVLNGRLESGQRGGLLGLDFRAYFAGTAYRGF
jgi:hypothetical protein